MGVFVLAPLVAAMALPGMRHDARVRWAVAALLIGFGTSLLLAGIQTQLIVAAHASNQFGVNIFSPSRLAALAASNRSLHGVGMLAIPCTLWLAGYARFRWRLGERAETPWHRSVAIFLTLALLGWIGVAGAPAPPLETLAYHPRWAELVERNPNFVPARVNLALHLETVGEIGPALDHYDKARRTEPDRFEPQFNFGSLLLRSGRAAEAIPSLSAAVELRPDHAGAQRNLGLALAAGEGRCEALPHLERAIALDPASRAALETQRVAALRLNCNDD